MVQYATADDLAAYLQLPINQASMDLILQLASADFDDAARTTFAPTETVYSDIADGRFKLTLPRFPVVSIQTVTVNGDAVTDYAQIGPSLFRAGGFGDIGHFPPDQFQVNYTYGYATAPDDVRLAVLESAAQPYQNPTGATMLQIDDYRASYEAVGLTPRAERIAKKYRRSAASVGPDTQVEPEEFISSQWYSPMNNIYGGGVIIP